MLILTAPNKINSFTPLHTIIDNSVWVRTALHLLAWHITASGLIIELKYSRQSAIPVSYDTSFIFLFICSFRLHLSASIYISPKHLFCSLAFANLSISSTTTCAIQVVSCFPNLHRFPWPRRTRWQQHGNITVCEFPFKLHTTLIWKYVDGPFMLLDQNPELPT